ncbi:UrcA family protein [Phenylobacterium sp.]|uniref:UrcA family protein n=1 Tax=Phenylobacterium sp. TaxID=1871053 RepID=UPI0025EE72E5|nr:UrcA family protein [Phenylobacterium sp.]
MIASLGCAMALAGALSAHAAGQSEADAARDIERQPVQVVVKAHDLDLTSQDGSATMLQRLSRAAQEACGASSFSVPDYRWAVKRSDCYRGSMSRAVADLGAPAVTRLYEEHPVLASN